MAKVAPAIGQGFTYVKAHPRDPKVVVGLGGAALLVLLLLMTVAAATGTKDHARADATEARTEPKASETPASPPSTSKIVEPLAARQAPAPAPLPSACRLTKEATRLAGKASKDVPLEIAMNAAGDRARIGLATDAGVAQGLSVDLASFQSAPEFSAPVKGKVRAVVPLTGEGKTSYVVNGDGPNDKLQAWRTPPGESSLVIGWAGGAISVASKSIDPPVALWPLEGSDAPDAIRGASGGESGQVVVFRRNGEIFGGAFDANRKPRGNLVKVAGAGAPAGSPIGAPAVAVNGRAVAVAFADRATSSDPWGIRIGSASLGSFPTQTSSFALPPGGPGKMAIAPAIAGLADGRWLLVWTEGSGGDHDVRGQTLDAELRPIGAPFPVSHEGGNAGQGAVALSGGRGLIAYLTLTDQGYEVWGAAVDCR